MAINYGSIEPAPEKEKSRDLVARLRADFAEIAETDPERALPRLKIIAKPIEALTREIDHEELSVALSMSPIEKIRSLVADLANSPSAFGIACATRGVTIRDLVRAYKAYILEMGRIEAGKKWRSTVADHAKAAAAFDDLCPACKGAKRKLGCPRCGGTGKVTTVPDTERAEFVARVAGIPLDPPKGPLVAVNVGATAAGLEDLIDATGPDAIDVEATPVREEDA